MRLPDGQAHAPPLELLVPIASSVPAPLGDVLRLARQPVAGPCASAIRTKAGRSVATMRPVTSEAWFAFHAIEFPGTIVICGVAWLLAHHTSRASR